MWPQLLRRVRRKEVHQCRTQTVIGLQAQLLQLLPHVSHLLWIEALLDNTADERRELWLLPATFVCELDVHEVQTLERMILRDSAKHVHAAAFTCPSLDNRLRVHDMKLGAAASN